MGEDGSLDIFDLFNCGLVYLYPHLRIHVCVCGGGVSWCFEFTPFFSFLF